MRLVETLSNTGSTEWVNLPDSGGAHAGKDVRATWSVSGTWAGTVDLERRLRKVGDYAAGSAEVVARDDNTANGNGNITDPSDLFEYRWTFTRTSGSAVVVIAG